MGVVRLGMSAGPAGPGGWSPQGYGLVLGAWRATGSLGRWLRREKLPGLVAWLWLGAPLGLVAAVAAGCTKATPRQAPVREPSLAAQVELVRAGKLDQIQLESTPVSDGDLQQVAGLTALRSLLLDDPRSVITAAGIAAMGELPGLAHLRVRGEGIDDAAMEAVSRLQGLKVLNVPRGRFSDGGLRALAKLPHLEQLRFHSPHVSDAGMQTLASLPELKRIHLIAVPITEKGLLALATMPQLESLYVDDVPLPDSAWSAFFRHREALGKPVHVHVDEQHHDRDPHAHPHP